MADHLSSLEARPCAISRVASKPRSQRVNPDFSLQSGAQALSRAKPDGCLAASIADRKSASTGPVVKSAAVAVMGGLHVSPAVLPQGESLISMRNLRKVYRKGTHEFLAISDVTMDIHDG